MRDYRITNVNWKRRNSVDSSETSFDTSARHNQNLKYNSPCPHLYKMYCTVFSSRDAQNPDDRKKRRIVCQSDKDDKNVSSDQVTWHAQHKGSCLLQQIKGPWLSAGILQSVSLRERQFSRDVPVEEGFLCDKDNALGDTKKETLCTLKMFV